MTILNYEIIDDIVKYGNLSHHEMLDTWLMQWFNSSDGLKGLLIDILIMLHSEIMK